LAGDDGRTGLVAVFENIQQIAPALVVELGQGPLVDDQHRSPSQFRQRPAVAAVAASERQVGE